MKVLGLILLNLFLTVVCIPGQVRVTWPIGVVNITGNYGEIRPNHFHAGLDFSTEGLENLPIYAVKPGYISRVKVSPYGYGKVIYITHPDGKITVYAHQNRFMDTLERFVRAEQYRQMNFEVELFPDKEQFKVKEGQIIGFSGNTGGSTGPHLHFEVRDELTEIPVNPLLYFKLLDTVRPSVQSLAFYDVCEKFETQLLRTIKIKTKNDSTFADNDSIVLKSSVLGIAFSGYDKEIANGNPNNIYEVELYLDSNLIYHHQLNYISFDQARYVNEFSDIIDKQKFQKCFTSKAYPSEMYKVLVNSGKIELKDTLFHPVQMYFTDESGNRTGLTYYIRCTQFRVGQAYSQNKFFVDCLKNYSYQSKNFDLNLPPKTFYNDVFLRITDEISTFNSFSIAPDNINFRWAGTLKVKLPKKFEKMPSKTVLVNGGSVMNPTSIGILNEYPLRKFGSFRLAIDTLGPELKSKIPLKKLKNVIKKADHITFILTDKLSGISKYDLYINGKWVLAEYDAKSDLLTYWFDPETPIGDLEIDLRVSDKVGNNSNLKLHLKR